MTIDKILKQKIKKIPQKPGVYLFKDKSGRIIYIGKAIDLKNRVRQHFRSSSFFNFLQHRSQTSNFPRSLASKKGKGDIADIDWIKTDNEKQALILENELIKKYKPRYNIQWKDDKSYFWVKFTQEEWPRIVVVHKNKLNPPQSPFYKGGSPSLYKRGVGGDFQKMTYLHSLDVLSQFLRLYAGEPIRIEAYDISNIQGKHATGSMIVFYGDKPSKSDYRKFRIKTVRGANDVAMLKEVLRRRLSHPEWPYPDLILIDGGQAQLAAAQRVAYSLWHMAKKQRNSEPLAISHTPYAIIALAKREEEIYTEYSSRPLKINKLPCSLYLVFQHIRDEAHRFAIFYYRYLHGKKELAQLRKNRKRGLKAR